GENLIADALGEDAIYTKFTAASTAQGTRVGSKSSKMKRRGDLHAEPTRLFDPDADSRLHGMETRILDSRRGFDEQTTGSRDRGPQAGRPDEARARSQTGKRKLPEPQGTGSTPAPLPAQRTRMFGELP